MINEFNVIVEIITTAAFIWTIATIACLLLSLQFELVEYKKKGINNE